MNKPELNVYLFFKGGKCAEAMEYYKGIFGGDLTMQKYGEMRGMEVPNSEDKIMHASLSGGLVTLMASDSTTDEPFGRSAVSISINGTSDNAEEVKEAFSKLAADGKVEQPLEPAPWGDEFGSLTDKYGFDWMVNIAGKTE